LCARKVSSATPTGSRSGTRRLMDESPDAILRVKSFYVKVGQNVSGMALQSVWEQLHGSATILGPIPGSSNR
jgi:hypothetical protein